MARLSKRKTCIKKLEERVDKLKNTCIAFPNGDDALELDNYLWVLHMVSYRKLQNIVNSRHLHVHRKNRKYKGKCPHEEEFLTMMI